MKLGIIGEEMIATAIKLAGEQGAVVEALYVIRVRSASRSTRRCEATRSRAEASLAEAKLLGEEHGVEVVGTTVRARAIGEAIVDAGPRVGRRPDRPRLRAALAAAVALLLADRRLRAPQGAVRGADRRVPAVRARRGARGDLSQAAGAYALRWPRMKAIVVGCGRVGSAVALELQGSGWDVTVLDENEDALGATRRGLDGRLPRRPRHGSHSCCARRASRTPTPSSSRPTATTRTS